jgi:hypothetical protein
LVIASGGAAGQYHGQTSQKSHDQEVSADAGGGAILRADEVPVSPSIAFSIRPKNGISIADRKSNQVGPYRAAILRESASEAQYQPRKGRSRLLLGLGVVLGAVYVGFLAFWYWATRIRPRAFDTPRRMH